MYKENEGRILPLFDEEGYKLPKNLSTQFRNVQGGLESLKHAADTITLQIKKVNKTLKINTTDLSQITTKVNEIEKRQLEHMKITKESVTEIKTLTKSVIGVLLGINNKVEKMEKEDIAKSKK